ncbi:hypothetical protein [Amycolatopsis sp. NPDC051903]|uniref:hypothetical protein n=1 Tax=Amycolatopsis sp. NPDC051903 TaxID=3363936 RepID=UPI003796EC4A
MMFQQTFVTATTPTGVETRPSVHRRADAVVSLIAQHGAAASDSRRYADLADRSLAAKLAAEDAAVETGLSPFERLTCPAHRRWIHQCIASPEHASPVTGHRWCRDCQCAVTVAIDELTGDVTMACPRCRRTPKGIATGQIVSACRASLATVHDHRAQPAPSMLHFGERRPA